MLVDFSRISLCKLHPYVWTVKQKCWEAYMDKQRGPSRNLTLKGSIREVKTGTGDSRGKETYSPCKAKAHLEFNLARDVKNKSDEKCFCSCISRERGTTENASPLLIGTGDLLTGNMEHAEMFHIFSIQSFLLTFRTQVHGFCLDYRRLILSRRRLRHKNWTCTSLWELVGCTHECSGS